MTKSTATQLNIYMTLPWNSAALDTSVLMKITLSPKVFVKVDNAWLPPSSEISAIATPWNK